MVLLPLLACQNQKSKTIVKQAAYSFYLGTYTDTESKGIYKLEMNESGHLKMIGLVAESENPSFLTFANNGKTLLAVNEVNTVNGMGTVESYMIEDGLKLVSRKPSGGAHPCFVTANKDGFVLTANYSGGNIGLLKLGEDGKLSELLDKQQHSGSGTNSKRQEKPHAHSVWFQPGSDQIIAVDLGTNELWLSKINSSSKKFIIEENNRIAMVDGAGPRHLAFHPNGKYLYVINELDNTITTLMLSRDEQFKLVGNVSSLPEDFEGNSFTADIHISLDGKFLYGSNRGHNSIAIFEILEHGKLNCIDHVSTRGDHPRNFSLSPDEKFLVVANQNTNNIVCFERDKTTGLLRFVDEIEAPKPVCVLFHE